MDCEYDRDKKRYPKAWDLESERECEECGTPLREEDDDLCWSCARHEDEEAEPTYTVFVTCSDAPTEDDHTVTGQTWAQVAKRFGLVVPAVSRTGVVDKLEFREQMATITITREGV